jgi:PhoPQ-activated pathogenicity-related protein
MPCSFARKLLLLLGIASGWSTCGSVAQADEASGALDRYVAAPDPTTKWVQRRQGTLANFDYVEGILTSQTWHGTAWKHQVFVIKPKQVRHPEHALLLIAGGSWKPEFDRPPEGELKYPAAALLVGQVAEQVGSPVAVVLQVPFEPIDGMVEDDLISYTFEQYLKTGDDTWPLLLPMVKSAVRAMDQVQVVAKEKWSLDVERFTVTGASKRGWTTWLIAAVDPRVEALAPMVIDTLNMAEQMPHQLATWGKFSEMIHNYTDRGIQKYLLTSQGAALRSIVDPYSYRQRITQPKLIVLGTNDRYWTLDALNLYWSQLEGPKYVLYVPNQGHGIADPVRLIGSTSALVRSMSGEIKLPKLDWNSETTDDRLSLRVTSDQKPQEVRAWVTTAATRDFRDVRWESRPMTAGADGKFSYDLARPASGFAAMFGELVFATDSAPYYLSTNVTIVGAKGK